MNYDLSRKDIQAGCCYGQDMIEGIKHTLEKAGDSRIEWWLGFML
jgi:hypothetical protein